MSVYGSDTFAYDFKAAFEESRVRARDRDEKRKRAELANERLYWRVAFPDLPAPARAELEKHAEKFGPGSVARVATVCDVDRVKVPEPKRPSRKRRTTAELRAEVLDLRAKRMVLTAIADTLNVSDARVRKIVREAELRKAA